MDDPAGDGLDDSLYELCQRPASPGPVDTSSRSSGRQPDGEGRACPGRTTDLDAPSHPLDDVLRDREAEAGARALRRVERLEDPVDDLRRDPHAPIADVDGNEA